MKDIILGLCFMILGVITIAVAQQYPTMPSLQYGPSMFPSLIGGGFFIGGLVLVATWLWQRLRSPRTTTVTTTAIDYRMFLISLLPCVLIAFYIMGSEYLGATLAMAIIMVILMLVKKTPLLLALAVSIAASLIISLIFSKYLLVPLPEGLLSVGG